MRRWPQAALLCMLVLTGAAAGDETTLVVCAPGHPSNTEEAQPTMNELARAVEISGGLGPGSLTAVYHPTLDGGLAALGEAGLALVPLPFYLEHRQRLRLTPLLRVERTSGKNEVWSLVAKRDTVHGPDSLQGWELAGMSAYSARFVRRVVLADWGQLSEDTTIRFNGRVLGVLRRAARGDPVVALLDQAQTAALSELPYAAELEVVARSTPLIGSLLCSVDDRLESETAGALREAFVELDKLLDAHELLETLQITRFAELDAAALRATERAFDGERAASP